MYMTRSELIAAIANRYPDITKEDADAVVMCILSGIEEALGKGKRVEIRDFGAFSLHYRKSRYARNPKTGASVEVDGKYHVHFKPGKALRERVNAGID